MADNKQEKPNGKEEKAPKTGIIPRAGRAARHPIQTTKRATKYIKDKLWDDPNARNAARDAVQHHANDDEVIKQMSAGQTEEGETQKPRVSATTADPEKGSLEDFKLWNAWLCDSIINGAPKVEGDVQEPIWNLIGEKEFTEPLKTPPKDEYDEQPTRSPEEKERNEDSEYQKAMVEARKDLAERLEQKNVIRLHSDEVDIILRTMLYLTEEVKDEKGEPVKDDKGQPIKQYKYRDEFYKLLLDGAHAVKPNEEGRIIGHVLNYLTTKYTTNAEQPKEAEGTLADENVAHQFFTKYSYVHRKTIADYFYSSLSGPEELKEKYTALLLQEIRSKPESLDELRDYFEKMPGVGTSDIGLINNLKKIENKELAEMLEGIRKMMGAKPYERVTKKKNKDLTELLGKIMKNLMVEPYENVTKDRLAAIVKEKDDLTEKLKTLSTVDNKTKRDIGILIEFAYEAAKTRKEKYEYEELLRGGKTLKTKDEVEPADYTLKSFDKKIEKNEDAIRMLLNKLRLADVKNDLTEKLKTLSTVDKKTKTDLGALIELAYEEAVKAHNDGGVKTIENLLYEFEYDRFPVLKKLEEIVKKLYKTEGPAKIKISQYLMAPVYYSGGRKDVYNKLEVKPERWDIRLLRWMFRTNWIARKLVWPFLEIEVLKWEKVKGKKKIDETEALYEKEKEKKPESIGDKILNFIRTDWAERARLKVKNEKWRHALWYLTFPVSAAQAAAVISFAAPYYLVLQPIVASWKWTAKNWNMPEHIIEEKRTAKHDKNKKSKKITKQVLVNSAKGLLSAGITALYLIGIPYNFNYVQKGFGYMGRGIATVWDNMWGGRIAFYDSRRDKKMKEMKAGMQNEIKRAKTSKGNFVSEYFRYELEENLKSRDHYVSAYYSEPPERWLARTYYGVDEDGKSSDRISHEDVQLLGKIAHGDAEGTEKQKTWIEKYAFGDVVEAGKEYGGWWYDHYTTDWYVPAKRAPVTFIKNKDETYSLGINATAAHEKKKQQLDKQLAWLEKHPAVVEFLEEAHSLANVKTVTNGDFNIKIDSAEESQWHNEGWHGPESRTMPKLKKDGKIAKDKDGKVIMEERNVYYRKGYIGAKKDGIKLNPHKTEELVAELMKQKEPMTYLKENMLELIDNDYFIAADVSRCMGSYGVNLENAKFLMSNPHVMAWLQPMLEEGHSVYYVKRERSNDMVELVKREGGAKGIVLTVELETDVVARVIVNAKTQGILEDKTSVFGAYCARVMLQEQLKGHYPNAENVSYLIQNEITTHANKNDYVVVAGKEKELAWKVLWEIGRENADVWKTALVNAGKKTAYEDAIRKSVVMNALFPALEPPSADIYKSKREEIISKVLVYATDKGLVKEEIPEYKPLMSVRQVMLDYMSVGGYNIIEGKADSFVKKAREHIEGSGEVEDLKQPDGAAVSKLEKVYGIIWIPPDEASDAGAGVPDLGLSMAITKIITADTKTKLLTTHLPENNLYKILSGKYDAKKVNAAAEAILDKRVKKYYDELAYHKDKVDKGEAYKTAQETGKDVDTVIFEMAMSTKEMDTMLKDLSMDGLMVLTEEMKNKDLEKSVEEQTFAKNNVGDVVLRDGEKVANWIITHKTIQENFPLKDDEEESKKTKDKPADDTPKKKKTKKKKQDDAGGPPPVTF